MEYEIFIDMFFLRDFLLNFLALSLTAPMGRFRGTRRRRLLAAAAGSTWNCLLLFFPAMPLWAEMSFTIGIMGSFMTAFSFSLKKAAEVFKADLYLFLSVMLTGGALLFLEETFWLSGWEALFVLAAVSAAGAGFLKEMAGEGVKGKERISVWLYYRGKKKEFKALVDSGNRLREPVSGKPVSVISMEDCKGFCDTVSGVLYIPFRAVGTKSGLLPGIVFEKMEIYRRGCLLKIERPIVAVSKEPLSGNGDFSMLLPEELF